MSTFLKVLSKAGLSQVLDWDLFKNIQRPAFYIDDNQTVWVKWDHLTTKYHFNIEDTLQSIEVETNAYVGANA